MDGVAQTRTDIRRYIEFLNGEMGLFVSLHPLRSEPLIGQSELVHFNLHNNAYCRYLKTHVDLWRHCIDRQGAVLETCACGRCTGVCHAGVQEYIYPLIRNGAAIGFISAGSYQADESVIDSYVKRISRLYGFDANELRRVYLDALSPDLPDSAQMDTLLRPLCHMIELAYTQFPPAHEPSTRADRLYDELLHELQRNHCGPIAIDDLCARFYCSRSTISHLFKQRSGHSISQYVNALRIGDAKVLLRNTDMNMTDIAAEVGFSDSNYFALVFRKSEGMTPTEYRAMPK